MVNERNSGDFLWQGIDEIKKLKSVMRKRQTLKIVRNRCQIIIDLDEAHGNRQRESVCQEPPDTYTSAGWQGAGESV